MSYLLRVRVPDRPGALGALASALGAVEADIVSLDVVARLGSYAVDDILVELPLGRMADALVTAAQSVGAQVDSVRRYAGGADLHRDLDLLDAVVGDPDRSLQTLVDVLPGVFRADWALLVDGDDVIHASSAAPDAPADDGVSALVPCQRARCVDGEAWLPVQWRDSTVALAPVGRADRVVALGRVGGPPVLETEVLRLAHLALLASAVADGHHSPA